MLLFTTIIVAFEVMLNVLFVLFVLELLLSLFNDVVILALFVDVDVDVV